MKKVDFDVTLIERYWYGKIHLVINLSDTTSHNIFPGNCINRSDGKG